MREFVHLSIILTLFQCSVTLAEDYCVAKPEPQQANITSREWKSMVGALAFAGGDLLHTLYKDKEWLKYTGKIGGTTMIVSMIIDALTSKKPVSSREWESLLGTFAVASSDLLSSYYPDKQWIKYVGKGSGTGTIMLMILEASLAGADNDFAAFYKKHPDDLKKLAQLSDNQLKVLTSADETGEFANLVKQARPVNKGR